ncbi:hypothetical protein J5N97_029413 [Dioscorea zingiberensis]|uniref:Uncharacterized protein n=1 Tax=Dioscorea zingiberensis TaxID=325984 RepID=A0A9D5H5L6_9LILI|nr:hypothetical protein J5N97_029413 [Dioscorea zingiberensis]
MPRRISSPPSQRCGRRQADVAAEPHDGVAELPRSIPGHMIFAVYKGNSVGSCHPAIVRFTGFSQRLVYQFQGDSVSLAP